MAGSYGFGGASGLTGYTDNWVNTGGIGLPTGRAAANGVGYARIYALSGFVRGRGASRTVVLSLGSAVTGAFGVGSAGSAADTGWQGCSWLVAGGSATFTEDFNGSCYFGRGGGGTSTDSYGTNFSGQLGGALAYTESPTQPTGLSATPNPTTPGAVNLSWSAPADNGGEGINGYRIEYSTSPSFAGASAVNVGNVLSTTITGLSPGTVYYFRVAAKNYVTDLAGTWSVYSGSTSVLVRSGAKVWNGSAWVPASVRVWDGAAWVGALVRVWDGDSWENAV